MTETEIYIWYAGIFTWCTSLGCCISELLHKISPHDREQIMLTYSSCRNYTQCLNSRVPIYLANLRFVVYIVHIPFHPLVVLVYAYPTSSANYRCARNVTSNRSGTNLLRPHITLSSPRLHTLPLPSDNMLSLASHMLPSYWLCTSYLNSCVCLVGPSFTGTCVSVRGLSTRVVKPDVPRPLRHSAACFLCRQAT